MDKQSNIDFTNYTINYPINEIIILLITVAISVVYSSSVNRKNTQHLSASYGMPMFIAIVYILFYGTVRQLSSNGTYTFKIELLRIFITLVIPTLIFTSVVSVHYLQPNTDPRHNVYTIPYKIMMFIGWSMVIMLIIALLVAAIYPNIYIQNIQWIMTILFNMLISSVIISTALLSSEP